MQLKQLFQYSMVAIICGLASCKSSTPVQTLPSGLRVQVVPVEKSDIVQVLDVKMWKFIVTLPKPNQTLLCNLELRRKGKMFQTAGGVSVGPISDAQAEVFVGLHPLGDSWSKSDKFKSYVRVAGSGSSGIKNNPFKVFSSFGYGDAVLQKDGSFLLMVGSKGKSADWPLEDSNDIALVLKMTPLDEKYPK